VSAPDLARFAVDSLDLLCIADDNGMFRWVNAAWTRLLGWSEAELKARPFLDFVHPEDVEATLAEVATLSEGVPTIRFINRYRTKDGRYVWLEWVTRPYEGGLLYAIARDVGERQVELLESRRRVRLLELAEQVSRTGHWRLGVADERPHWSPEVYRIHGLDPTQPPPLVADAIDAYHPEDREHVNRHVAVAMEQGRGFDFELRLVRADGEVRLVHSLGRTELNDAGEVEALFGVFRDITDDARLRAWRNRELEAFAYAAAHGLQGPLETVVGLATILAEEAEALPPQAGGRVQRLGEGARYLRRLVDGMTAFASTHVRDDAMEEAPLGDLVRAAAETLRDAPHLALEIGPMPTVRVDAARLRLVFEHLFDNVVRHAGGARRVTVSARREGSTHHLELTDDGVGFDPAHAERVFGLFQTLAPRAAEDERHTGLGLSVCRRVIEGHGGRIHASPQLGAGVTIGFTIPERA